MYFKEMALAIMEADKSKLWTSGWKTGKSRFDSNPKAISLEKREETSSGDSSSAIK